MTEEELLEIERQGSQPSPSTPTPASDYESDVQKIAEMENPPTFTEQAVDVATRGVQQFGTGSRMGLSPTIGEPDSMYESGMRMAGETATFSLAFPLALANRIRRPIKAVTKPGFIGAFSQGVKNFSDETMDYILKHPVLYPVAETVAGFGAGVGGSIASEVIPDSDAAQVIGELGGGVLSSAPLAITVALYRTGTTVVKNLPLVRTMFTPKETRARARIERATTDPKGAADSMGDELLPGLTPAQQTGDAGLLALEKSVLKSTDELTRVGDDQIFDMNEVIKDSLKEVGGDVHIERTREMFDAASEHLTGLLDTRLRIAARRAEERIAALKPGSTRVQQNTIARQEVEKALEDTLKQESQLYDLIPEEVMVPTISSRKAVEEIKKSTGQARQKDIPSEARSFLNPKSDKYLGNNTSVLELRDLQSSLRETARISKSEGRYNKARIANKIADSITDDFARAKSEDGDVQGLIDAAVSFSRTKHDRFGKGAVSRILSSKATGADSVADALTLEVTIGGSGPKSREAFKELKTAIGENPEEFAGAVEDFIKDDFMRKVFKGDKFSASSANNYMSSNQDLLMEFPELKADLDLAIADQNATSLMTRRNESIGKRLRNPNVSKTALVIQGDPDKIFTKIEASRTPGPDMQKVINRALKDESGEAMQGLKTAFIDRLLRNSSILRDEVSYVSGRKMQEVMNTPIVTRLFSKPERERLAVIMHTAKRMDLARNAKPSKEGVMGDIPGKISETLASVGAAQTGRVVAGMTGGGTVQTPGIFAARAREVLGKWVSDPSARLISDAIQDEQLFKALLLDEKRATPKQMLAATRKLNGWLAAVAGDVGALFYNELDEEGDYKIPEN